MEQNDTSEQKNGACWVLCSLQDVLLGIGVFYHQGIVACCAFSQLWMSGWLCFLKKRQKEHWLSGLALVFPAMIIGGISTWQMKQITDVAQSPIILLTIAGLAALQIVPLLLLLKADWTSSDVNSRARSHFLWASLAALLPIIVSPMLWLGEPSEWAGMICLTGCFMCGIVLVLGIDLLLCALCKARNTLESIHTIRRHTQQKRRLLHFAIVGKDAALVLVKLCMSIASTSFFMFSNALFSGMIGLARYTALQMEAKPLTEQLRLYRKLALILILSGLCYAGYSIRLFFGGTPGEYGMIMALAIALFTFVDFGIQIRELVRLRRQHSIEAEALRLVNLSAILVTFVLTQTALLSFSGDAAEGVLAASDGLAGVLFGGLVVLVGIAAKIRCKRFEKHGLPQVERG